MPRILQHGVLVHSTEIHKAGSGFDDRPENPFVNINPSSP